MPEPDFPYIKVSEAGLPIVNGIYPYTGISALRPYYINVTPPLIYLQWLDYPYWQWILTPPGPPSAVAYYQTIEKIDWCYEIFQATWQLGPNPDTTLPLPVLEPLTGPGQPSTTALLTEDQLTPPHIYNLTPTFTWVYIPADRDLPQDAYHVQVASSPLLLNAHQPDLWDSGIIESAKHQAIYAGEQLADLQMYFWAVRVRDTAGFWSEDW